LSAFGAAFSSLGRWWADGSPSVNTRVLN
jgi:hypothetical protein